LVSNCVEAANKPNEVYCGVLLQDLAYLFDIAWCKNSDLLYCHHICCC
jgi:hypothetical protein